MMGHGDRIKDVLEEIKQQKIPMGFNETNEGIEHKFGDSRYEVSVILNPEKWLGLEFTLKNSKITYPINTDLYDVTNPKNKGFVEGIEADIVEFLHAFVDGRIKVAYNAGRPMILVPLKNEYVLLKQGRFFSSATRYKNDDKKIAEIMAKADFQPFKIR